jgi:hypothetical protein
MNWSGVMTGTAVRPAKSWMFQVTTASAAWWWASLTRDSSTIWLQNWLGFGFREQSLPPGPPQKPWVDFSHQVY